MEPKKIDLLDFDSLSTDEIDALIHALTVKHEERLNRARRRKKAEEYATRIYDLISEALYDGFNILIDSTVINQDCDVEVYD